MCCMLVCMLVFFNGEQRYTYAQYLASDKQLKKQKKKTLTLSHVMKFSFAHRLLLISTDAIVRNFEKMKNKKNKRNEVKKCQSQTGILSGKSKSN